MNNNETRLTTIILAAGKGTRMQSDLAKVLHPLHSRPMIQFVADTALAIKSDEIIVIVGHQADKVRHALNAYPVQFVEQKEQLGTGHAVMQASASLEGHAGNLLILAGDTPLLSPITLEKLLSYHNDKAAAVSILTAFMDDVKGLGRIIRSEVGDILRIVEEKDATNEERLIKEINTSTYCFSTPLLLGALKLITPHNKQGEFYLTDTVGVLRDQGHNVDGFSAKDPKETIGINTRDQLMAAEAWIDAHKMA